MKDPFISRRRFLKTAGIAAGAFVMPNVRILAETSGAVHSHRIQTDDTQSSQAAASDTKVDYTLRIRTVPIEIAPDKIITLTTYNDQYPGPLLRFKEGQKAVVDVINDTDTPEQLHWHGQTIPSDVDGAAEEGTPFIPPHGSRRIVFTPRPAGFRFYHTHVRGGANLYSSTYSGEVGPVYIEPKNEAGNYDREVFLTLKEFEPTFSRGGDMPQNFLSPATKVKKLKDQGESAMKASRAKGMPHGYEVGYGSFTINGRMLGHGEAIRVKRGERVLFHVLNGSATEIRSLALPGHTFHVVAMDGNPVPNPTSVPVLWLGTAERISAIVTMNHPGTWIMGDTAADDRRHGMGIVVEYAGSKAKPQWTPPPANFKWNYTRFAKPGGAPTAQSDAAQPDETFDMLFAKDNAAENGFNRWTINGVAYPMTNAPAPPQFYLRQGRRYRLMMRNASDDIHPIHLHRHIFELASVAGAPTAGIMKDVVMVDGYQEVAIDFVANNPGPTLFHCHQQLHMDFGFMSLFHYVS